MQYSNDGSIHPSPLWYLLALGLFVLGFALMFYSFQNVLKTFQPTTSTIKFPGKTKIDFDKGLYTLSLSDKGLSLFLDRIMRNEIRVSVREYGSKKRLELNNYFERDAYSIGNFDGVAIFDFEIEKKGSYLIEVDGSVGVETPKATYLVVHQTRLDQFTKFYKLISASLLWINSTIVALIVAIATFVNRQINKRFLELQRGELIISTNPGENPTAPFWSGMCHLASFCWLLGIPFGNFLGPLFIWLMKRDDDPMINEQGKEALNFQISFSVYMIVISLSIYIFIGFVLLLLVPLIGFFITLDAGLKSFNKERFRYPLIFRIIK